MPVSFYFPSILRYCPVLASLWHTKTFSEAGPSKSNLSFTWEKNKKILYFPFFMPHQWRINTPTLWKPQFLMSFGIKIRLYIIIYSRQKPLPVVIKVIAGAQARPPRTLTSAVAFVYEHYTDEEMNIVFYLQECQIFWNPGWQKITKGPTQQNMVL